MTATQQSFFKQASDRRWIFDNFPSFSDSYFYSWYEVLPENWEHLSGAEITHLASKLKALIA